ncbi:MAG: hypothetical protein F6J87_19460 [Spirulina sp. SIO3F2]|nr:hypothetical protein [Spirulina sp. SIO3F2]
MSYLKASQLKDWSSMSSPKEKLLEIYRVEYEKLKTEQLQRITFRDVQIPFSMFLGIAPILSVAFAKDNPFGYNLLLVVPLICVSLGWAYVANDEKISTIGDYVRDDLRKSYNLILDELAHPEEVKTELKKLIFGWEHYHKNDTYKEERKITQLFVNLLTFVFSGLIALAIFLVLKGSESSQASISTFSSLIKGWQVISGSMKLLVFSEIFTLIGLGWWIYIYSGFKKNFYKLLQKRFPNWMKRYFRKFMRIARLR